MKVLANNQHTGSPSLRLNADKVRELQRAHKIGTDAELARRVDMNPASLYRYMQGESSPSNRILAKFKVAFPLVSLDDLTVLEVAA